MECTFEGMCRIGGYWAWGGQIGEVDLSWRLRAMAAAQAHGGPDDEGIWWQPEWGIGFAHRRLSILDLSAAGHQPMSRGRFVITYNGEVYNFRELRVRLEREGVSFTTQTDTEVILAGWAAWEAELLPQMRGMWAFGLWDGEALWLVRDRFGVKPLYYTAGPGWIAFASELGALLRLPEVSRQVTPERIAAYLAYGFIPGGRTLYANISQVPPGHYVHITPDRLETKPWWSPRPYFFAATSGPPPTLEEAEETLTEAFRYRLVSDVPVGLFLSGGLDSSLVAALLRKKAGAALTAFTLGFQEPQWDEAPWAQKIASFLGLPHIVHYITEAEVLAEVEKLPALYGQPFGDSSALAVYKIAQVARREVKVVLSADGGDELFGGYVRYTLTARQNWRWRLIQLLKKSPALAKLLLEVYKLLPVSFRQHTNLAGKLYKLLHLRLTDYGDFLQVFPQIALTEILEGLSGEALLPYLEEVIPVGWDEPEARMYADTRVYLVEDILRKVDRATMAVALEAREPFLDEAVLALRARLGARDFIEGRTTKRFLKRILARYLPAELWDRPKQGFSPPIPAWLRGPLHDRLRHYLESAESPLRDYPIRLEKIRPYYEDFVKGEDGLAGFLWNVFVFGLWTDWITATPPISDNLPPAISAQA
jgi:asparagine synthase (glutamine-hydrolysing)